MTAPSAVRAGSRNDSGSVLIGELTAMIMTGLLLSSVVGVMWLSVRLVRTAPPAHNPTVYGTLVASGGRLGDSLSQPLFCDNPHDALTRSDCLDVKARQLHPIADPAQATRQDVGDYAMCWAVTIELEVTPGVPLEKRRLECWQYLHSGYLQSWVHPPKISLGDTTDYLFFEDNQWEASPDPELSGSVVSGLTAVKWQCRPAISAPPVDCSPGVGVSNVELLVCASIRPEQRNAMKDGFVPFCDGTIGVQLPSGADRPLGDDDEVCDRDEWLMLSGTPGVYEDAAVDCEGYLLPPINVYTSG